MYMYTKFTQLITGNEKLTDETEQSLLPAVWLINPAAQTQWRRFVRSFLHSSVRPHIERGRKGQTDVSFPGPSFTHTLPLKSDKGRIDFLSLTLTYSVYTVIVFFTLVMYHGKRVNFQEVSFGYD